jgi:mRNA interferase RelE/StbE
VFSAGCQRTRERIQSRVKAYAADPKSFEHDVVKLQGRDGYRMRVGIWRVIFDQDGAVMAIVAIGPRGQVYNR